MKLTRPLAAALFCVLAAAPFAVPLTADKSADDKAKEQASIRQMAQDRLSRLYQSQPAAKSAVQSAAGYAVFSNTGIKILLAGSGKGKGIAVNNSTKAETFMKMLEVQAGLGFGVKKFSVVFVFTTAKAFNDFVNSGWQFGSQASAAAKTSESGGALQGATSVSDGVFMYQMTDKGLAAEVTVKSTKYRKDDDLN